MTAHDDKKHSECCTINGVECERGLNKKRCPDWKAASAPSSKAAPHRDILEEVEDEIRRYRAELEVAPQSSVDACKLAWTIEQYVRDLRAEVNAESAPSAIGRAPKWLVQAGGERYDTWLCATREDVRRAFCEALFGDVESATAAEIDGYMEEFDRSGAEQESKHPSQTWRFEDGWLGFITLSPAHDDIGHTRQEKTDG